MAVSPQAAPVPPAARALSLGQLLDRTFSIYRRNFTFFALCALIVSLPDIILEILGFSGISGLVRLLYAPFVLALLYIGASEVVLRGRAQFGWVLRAAFARFGNFAGIYAGYILAVLALLIPPLGLWLIVRWMPAACVLAAEPVKPRQAFRRSAELVSGQWWRAFFVMTTIVILEVVVVLILAFSIGVVVGLLPGLDRDTSLEMARVAGLIVGSFAVPLVPIGYTLLYVDLRVRKEGFDLDQLAKSAADAA
jgi:hypothetical protein